MPWQQCTLGMLSMLQSFPFIFQLEVLVNFHINVFKKREVCKKGSQRHRLQFAKVQNIEIRHLLTTWAIPLKECF